MPGNVSTSTATTVLPQQLCAAWGEGFLFPAVETGEYADGRTQRRYDASGWRREWRLTRRLTWSEFSTLRSFWTARKGCLEAFYFYPRLADYDATGVSTTGRFKVKFLGSLSEQYDIGRMVLAVSLQQVP